ncbi:MAG: hypothetical protein P1U46_03590 [Patescibacteria group bacterium]|nr:hypothetical protein [Patescibacteria group bacterium]
MYDSKAFFIVDKSATTFELSELFFILLLADIATTQSTVIIDTVIITSIKENAFLFILKKIKIQNMLLL